MDCIIFLGTGGGRFVNLSQRRHCGGIWIEFDGAKILVDPGPGSLVRALDAGLNPGNLDAIISTHNHLDHYNDVEVMAEAMTHGLKRNIGGIFLQEDVVPYISDYHKEKIKTTVMGEGKIFNVGELSIQPLVTFNHSNALGLRFKTSHGDITYSSDTRFHQSIIPQYTGSDILILNTIFPSGHKSDTHLNTDDAVRIAKACNPKKLILTHFGVRFLTLGPETQADLVTKETGVETIAATDGLKVII